MVSKRRKERVTLHRRPEEFSEWARRLNIVGKHFKQLYVHPSVLGSGANHVFSLDELRVPDDDEEHFKSCAVEMTTCYISYDSDLLVEFTDGSFLQIDFQNYSTVYLGWLDNEADASLIESVISCPMDMETAKVLFSPANGKTISDVSAHSTTEDWPLVSYIHLSDVEDLHEQDSYITAVYMELADGDVPIGAIVFYNDDDYGMVTLVDTDGNCRTMTHLKRHV